MKKNTNKLNVTLSIVLLTLFFLTGYTASMIIEKQHHKDVVPNKPSVVNIITTNVVVTNVFKTNVIVTNVVTTDKNLIEIAGVSIIPNFHKVTNNIYRGAQPTETGWRYLHDVLGITNVVKLNTEKEGSDNYAKSLGMNVYYFPISLWEQMMGPSSNKMTSIVAAIKNNTYIHCGSDSRTKSEWNKIFNNQGGQDRTGLAVAEYRILVNGWTKKDARKEMLEDGFHRSLLGLDWYIREKTPDIKK